METKRGRSKRRRHIFWWLVDFHHPVHLPHLFLLQLTRSATGQATLPLSGWLSIFDRSNTRPGANIFCNRHCY